MQRYTRFYYIEEFITLFHYIRTIKFEDKPDYQFIIMLIDDVIKKTGISTFPSFDWEKKPGDSQFQ